MGFLMEPFIKWVGGKRQLLSKIKEAMPPSYNRYFEPFLGGGALLLEIAPENAVVGDFNKALVETYQWVAYDPDEVMRYLNALDDEHNHLSDGTDDKQNYTRVRREFNLRKLQREGLTCEAAAMFIWLNKHCFNGLYRENKKGEFNVPYNSKKSGRSVEDTSNFYRVAEYLGNHTDIKCGDFEETCRDAQAGDFVFFDSPYAPLNPMSYVSYTKEGFSYDDHVRLSEVFKSLDSRGVKCMLTNHNTELINSLYSDFNLQMVDVKRSVNCKADGRKGQEVIITNY